MDASLTTAKPGTSLLRDFAMTENVKHVEVLRKVVKLLQNTPALQGREHDSLGIAFNKAIDYFAQREAAGDGEEWTAAEIHTNVNRDESFGDRIFYTAPRPTGTDLSEAIETLRHKLANDEDGWRALCKVMGAIGYTTPASAEPGELTDADVDRAVYAFNTHRRNHPEQWNEAMRAALATLACRPDARGGGQAVAVGEVREYGFVIYTHIKMPPAGTKLYTHPTPAALDAERLDWLEAQFKDGVHVEGCYSGNFDAGTIKRCATVFYGTEEQRGTSIREVIDAARATTGARHE
jgi:hypothetical protein